jgi:hypothetical protein
LSQLSQVLKGDDEENYIDYTGAFKKTSIDFARVQGKSTMNLLSAINKWGNTLYRLTGWHCTLALV